MFMDPIWAPVASHEHGRARSATFPATLEFVINGATVTDKYLKDNHEGLKKVMTALLSKDCVAFVEELLDDDDD